MEYVQLDPVQAIGLPIIAACVQALLTAIGFIIYHRKWDKPQVELLGENATFQQKQEELRSSIDDTKALQDLEDRARRLSNEVMAFHLKGVRTEWMRYDQELAEPLYVGNADQPRRVEEAS